MIDYRHFLPAGLSSVVYQASNRELAWPKPEALEVIDSLSAHQVAILGGEVWLPTIPGPTLPAPNLYAWDAGTKVNKEEWSDYVKRTTELAKNYITSFDWRVGDEARYQLPPFFNFTVCVEREYATLNNDLEILKQCNDLYED